MKLRTLLAILILSSQARGQANGENCFALPRVRGANLYAISTSMVISAEKRDAIWSAVQKTYEDDFQRLDMQPVLIEEDRPDFGALARQDFSNQQAQVVLFKGARFHQQMNASVLLLMLCHEVGHHLGGAPKSSQASWASVEGQADYFSIQDCWKKVSQRFPEVISSEDGLPAASRLTKILAGLRGELAFDYNAQTRDESVTPFLIEGHASLLCRWETFLRGWWDLPRPACWLPTF